MQPPTPQTDLPPPPPVVYSAAPPTHPVWFHTPAPAKWPLVVGIISAIYGVFNLSAHILTIALWLAFRGGKWPPMFGNSGAMNFFTGAHAWVEIVSTAVGLLASLLLVIAGIRTIQRRPSGRPLHLWYAWLFLAAVILTSAASLLGINPALSRTQAGFKPTGNFLIANVLLGLVIAGAYPTFILIWFLPRSRTPTPLPPPNPGWVSVAGQWLPERPRA